MGGREVLYCTCICKGFRLCVRGDGVGLTSSGMDDIPY